MGGGTLRLRWPASCARCGARLAAGADATWDGASKTATCVGCGSAPIVRGDPGASARREHERRFEGEQRAQLAAAAQDAVWREQVRADRPILGRLEAARTPKPAVGVASQATRAWAVGGAGEQRVGEVLNRCPVAYSLHDRMIPRTKANIDHLVLGPAAVYVVDAKAYTGRVEKRGERLFVAGRNRSRLLDGVRRQVAVVRAAVDDDRVPVEAVLCFVGAQWPLVFARPLRFGDVVGLWPDRLVELVATPGPMAVARTMELARRLAAALPPA